MKRIWLKLKIWKRLFKKIGANTIISNNIIVYNPENIEIGHDCVLNEHVMLNGGTSIIIGDYVHISPFCIINTGALDYKKKMAERVHSYKPVVIASGVWLGSNAIINPGVTIGENSVIGAGAVVTADIPANSLAAGVPARVIKNIDQD